MGKCFFFGQKPSMQLGENRDCYQKKDQEAPPTGLSSLFEKGQENTTSKSSTNSSDTKATIDANVTIVVPGSKTEAEMENLLNNGVLDEAAKAGDHCMSGRGGGSGGIKKLPSPRIITSCVYDECSQIYVQGAGSDVVNGVYFPTFVKCEVERRYGLSALRRFLGFGRIRSIVDGLSCTTASACTTMDSIDNSQGNFA